MTRLRLPVAIFLLLAAASVPLITIPAGAQECDRAKELDKQIARGDSDDLVVQSFVQEFGTQVYAEPPNKGFSRVAWWIPAMSLLTGLVLVIFVISRWRKRPAGVPEGPGAAYLSAEMLERARRLADQETED